MKTNKMRKLIILLLVANLGHAQDKSRKLIWEEQFNGKHLNESTWNIEIGDGCPNCGWGNNERQIYTSENHELKDGNLIITAKKDAAGKYTSTRITTKDKKQFKYGRIEARAKLPV